MCYTVANIKNHLVIQRKKDEEQEMSKRNEAVCDGVCPCTSPCPLKQALAAIGGKWKIRIICTLNADGTQRYNDLMRKTEGITSAMLSASLKELEADGIVARRQYAEIPPRVEYSLTEHGSALWPILHRLIHWTTGEAYDGAD